MSWDLPYAWSLGIFLFVVAQALTFFVELLLCAIGFSLYASVWENGYLKWKQEREMEPNDAQKELEKITKLVERYKLESKIRSDNPTAGKIWEEYQIILALTEGVEVFEEVEFVNHWRGELYLNCLKSEDDLR